MANSEMTVEELIFDESKPFHLKILEVLPSEAIIQIGQDNSKNLKIICLWGATPLKRL